VADVEQLSRRELLAVVVAQAELIEQQARRIEGLVGQVAELQRRLGQNSRNSSLPPSSDRFTTPKPQRRKRSGRKPGKQPGAPGANLSVVADPDEVVDHVPGTCDGCGAGLAGAEAAGMIARQVHDIPVVGVRVVEHRLHRRACGCGTVTTATAPAGVDAPACYGPNLRAVAVYLVVFQHVPVERAALLIADLCGAAVSTGWVAAQVARTADALDGVEKLIKTLITAAMVIGVDETSVNVAGDKQWLHVARTDLLTAYYLHPSRGRIAVDEFGVLPGFSGTVVHDALAVYDGATYAAAAHALCGAHIIRELTAAAEAHPDAEWPAQARSALADLAKLAQQARDHGLDRIPLGRAAEPLRLFRDAVRVGLAEHRRAPGRKQSKTRNLLERLRDREPEILRYTTDLAVPFTNNGSERDLRPVKTQLKISGCHRAATGAQNWLRVRGYISTVRKHGHDVLTALRDAITGNPWRPPQLAPT
jgi:transposase